MVCCISTLNWSPISRPYYDMMISQFIFRMILSTVMLNSCIAKVLPLMITSWQSSLYLTDSSVIWVSERDWPRGEHRLSSSSRFVAIAMIFGWRSDEPIGHWVRPKTGLARFSSINNLMNISIDKWNSSSIYRSVTRSRWRPALYTNKSMRWGNFIE